MLALPSHAKIWLHAAPTDMRKSFDGLCGLVLNAGLEVTSGDLFVFVNRARDRVKIMAFDGDGLAIWYKRLEAGRFQWPVGKDDRTPVPVDAAQMRLILDGIDLDSAKRRKRFQFSGNA